jgi:ribosomal protein L37AE/L43A
MKKLKELYHKLVDKIFGKRCKCINRKRETKTIFECVDCGKVLNG